MTAGNLKYEPPPSTGAAFGEIDYDRDIDIVAANVGLERLHTPE
jgi:hypothetical protein